MMRQFAIPFTTTLLSLVVLASAALAQQTPAPAGGELKTMRQQISYAIGNSIGQNMASSGITTAELDPAMIAKAIEEALTGKKSRMTGEQIEAAMKEFQRQMVAKQSGKQKAFLVANAKKEGVKTTASGLQYKVLKKGTGATPKATDTVRTHYHGTLIDGTVFDSSVQRGEPAEFPVNRVIKGWIEALQLMKVGDKWQLVIPADLAYGKNGTRGIAPDSTLIFEIELLGIVGQ